MIPNHIHDLVVKMLSRAGNPPPFSLCMLYKRWKGGMNHTLVLAECQEPGWDRYRLSEALDKKKVLKNH